VRNMLVPLNVGTSTTAMPTPITTTFPASSADDDVTGRLHVEQFFYETLEDI